jgi:hypothetical protein
LLPTPQTVDTQLACEADMRRDSPNLRAVAFLLPTPEAKLTDSGPDYARANRPASGGDDLTTTVFRHLLPTPEAADATGSRVSSEMGGTRPSGAKRAVTLATALFHGVSTPPRSSDGNESSDE